MGRLHESQLARAVDNMYAAAIHPEQWPDALTQFSEATGGFAASIISLSTGRDGPTYFAHDALDIARDYVEGQWGERNFRIELGVPLIRRGRKFVTERMLLDEGRLDRQQIQQEFFRKHGMRSFLSFEFVPGKVGGCVERGRRSFEDWELASFDKIHHHLQSIGNLAAARGAAKAEGAMQILQAIGRAAILLDMGGRIVGMNEGARPIVAGAFTHQDSRLIPLDRKAGPAFNTMVASVVRASKPHETENHPAVAIRSPDGLLILARAVPVNDAEVFDRAKGILFLKVLNAREDFDEPSLKQVFSLSNAEARLASLIANGVEISAAAEELGVAKSTLRTQLQSIFAKTGVKRQSELAALVSRTK